MFTSCFWCRLVLLAAVCAPLVGAADDARMASFEGQVLPVLQARCLICHGKPPVQAELDLRTVGGILRGGKSGPAVVPGSADQSLLLAARLRPQKIAGLLLIAPAADFTESLIWARMNPDIRREIMEKVPPLLDSGGYIPLADGRVREDVLYENYLYYRELLADATRSR